MVVQVRCTTTGHNGSERHGTDDERRAAASGEGRSGYPREGVLGGVVAVLDAMFSPNMCSWEFML